MLNKLSQANICSQFFWFISRTRGGQQLVTNFGVRNGKKYEQAEKLDLQFDVKFHSKSDGWSFEAQKPYLDPLSGPTLTPYSLLKIKTIAQQNDTDSLDAHFAS